MKMTETMWIFLLFRKSILPRETKIFSNTFVNFSVVSYILHLQVAQGEDRVSKKKVANRIYLNDFEIHIELVVWRQAKSILALLKLKRVKQSLNTLIHVSRQEAQQTKVVSNQFCFFGTLEATRQSDPEKEKNKKVPQSLFSSSPLWVIWSKWL